MRCWNARLGLSAPSRGGEARLEPEPGVQGPGSLDVTLCVHWQQAAQTHVKARRLWRPLTLRGAGGPRHCVAPQAPTNRRRQDGGPGQRQRGLHSRLRGRGPFLRLPRRTARAMASCAAPLLSRGKGQTSAMKLLSLPIQSGPVCRLKRDRGRPLLAAPQCDASKRIGSRPHQAFLPPPPFSFHQGYLY